MSKLPSMRPKKLVKLLKQNGFIEVLQTGSHLHFYHPTTKLRTTVPMHNRDLKKGTLASILRQSKIDVR